MKTLYFYTKQRPFQWSSGPTFVHYNDDGELIASLEEARALAHANRNETMRDDHVDTTYGVEYFD